jgi:Uma2 family endonuclease
MAALPDNLSTKSPLAELHSGDKMTREEFHRAYEEMPEDFQAELIGGIVYVASPLKLPHGTFHLTLGSAFHSYRVHTPGVIAADNVSVFLSDEDEVQPDLVLFLGEKLGGQSTATSDNYVQGPPELVAEIANTSRAIDLHRKKVSYETAGVKEYIVLCVHPLQLFWFDLTARERITPGSDGILRSKVFPGLWLDEEALVKDESIQLADVLNQGLQSEEHKAFVEHLRAKTAKKD